MSTYREWARRVGEDVIPEREFLEVSEDRRKRVARAIRDSGLSYNHIANGTRLGRKSVERAARCIDVRMEAIDRIMYYLEKRAENGNMADR